MIEYSALLRYVWIIPPPRFERRQSITAAGLLLKEEGVAD
jgi:hypothetical protein